MPKNLRLGVLAPEFVLFPNSDPKYSPKSQTLIFFWSFRHDMSSFSQTIWILATFEPEKGWSQALSTPKSGETKHDTTPHLSKILLDFEFFDWSYFCHIQMTRNKNQFDQQKFIWAHNEQNSFKYCPIHWNQPRQSKYFWSFWSQMNSNK